MMSWKLMDELIFGMPKRYQQNKADFEKTFMGSATTQSRSKECADYVLGEMPYSVGRMYVEKAFDKSSLNEVYYFDSVGLKLK